MRLKSLILGSALALLANVTFSQTTSSLQLVFVLDGLRPDSISEAETPNLFQLKKDGVWFENTHAVFPTVTRVNSSSLATGVYPARHGIMGNSIYIPAVNPVEAFNNDDFKPLLKLDETKPGQMVTSIGIAEILERAGKKMVVLSSGSTGSALLLAPKTHLGTGTVINGDFYPGTKVAYPDTVSETILHRFGEAPKKGNAKDSFDASVNWSMNVMREYVLPDLKPDVLFVWMTEPDHIQHGLGSGSPESLTSIRNDDRQIGLVIKKLETMGIRDKTNIMVVSDHGFAHTVFDVNVRQSLTEAGLISQSTPGEVVIASSGQSIALHVKDHNAKKIEAISKFLQEQKWIGVVFTAGKKSGPAHEGIVPGTFSLDHVHLGGHERSPDIVFTFPWSSDANPYGVRGTEYNLVSRTGKTGPINDVGANHGGIGPWTIRNTMLANGPDFKRGATVRTPSSNVDVTPTLLSILGITTPLQKMDGRPLLEALNKGPDQEQVAMETHAVTVKNGAYSAILQASEINGKRYIDKAWRQTPQSSNLK